MHLFRTLAALVAKILLGMFICSTAWAMAVQRLKSVDQFEEIIKSASYGSKSVIVVFEPDDFADPKEAHQVQDAVALARAWNGWICKDGQVINQLSDKMNYFSTRRVRVQVDDRARADLTFEWLWSRIEAAPHVPDDILQAMEERIPEALEPIKPAVSFVFEAKRSGNMRNFYSSQRARMHAFRQRNLGLRLISCESGVTKPQNE